MVEKERAVFTVFIRGTIHAVWREITKTDAIQPAMFNSRLHTDGLRPGGKIRMRTPNGKFTSVVGEVLEFDPPRRYAHTFKFTAYDDPPCTVIYDLKEVPGGVEFSLTIENVPAGTKTAKQMKQGGAMIVKTLKAVIESGRPAVRTRMLYAVFSILEPFSPKASRSEHWPV